ARTQRDIMRRVFHFAGHGYNSDSMNARIDESWTLRSQFPFLGTERGCDLDFINFDYNPLVRDRLLKAVATKDLDLAILHHHGSEDTQYLNNTPVSGMLSGKVDEVKSNLRSRMRRSRDVEKTKNEFISDYGIPESWFNGWDDPEVIAKDSADAAAVDLSIPDIKGKETNAKIVIIDACYNGAFNCDDYIAGYYLFNGGSTIAVKANSVNTLQDTWTNELMGLLAEGVCFGNWAKGQLTLESHLFGDAAFRFEARNYAAPGLDVAVNAKKNDSKYWARLLKKGSTDEKSLAIKNLAKLDAISSDELLRIEREDANPVVRLSAFMALQRRADNRLIEAIDLAINDSYELIQRLGMLTAINNAAPEFGTRIKAVKADPLSSPRVSFYGSSHSDNWNDSPAALEEFERLTDPDYSAKEKRFSIQGLRNSRNPHAIEYILNYISKGDDQELRIMAAEALGWYVDSYRRDDIVSGLKSLLDEVKDEKISYEIAKSINRLTDYRAK
ncbi:MAG: HEAT repeat domain-containing protein, partial [Bacteroidales bacterium]|nr:HEAT repeat domain-containing protein [Bacteroidales bacterium]